jgi:aspartate/methionine/tyrosine aminotransferase
MTEPEMPHESTETLAAMLPRRVREVNSSQIGLVADLGRDDPSVVKLWIGEVDLPTPPFIVEAAGSGAN